MCEKVISQNLDNLTDNDSIKEITRSLIFSQRGSRDFVKLFTPRIEQKIDLLTFTEQCYLLQSLFNHGSLTKKTAQYIEQLITDSKLRDVEAASPEDLMIITQTFCKTRVGSRQFHKLLEATILMRLNDIAQNIQILRSIGYAFESTGLVNIDTLRVLKDKAFHAEIAEDNITS